MRIYEDKITSRIFSKDAFIKTLKNIIYAVENDEFGGLLKFDIVEMSVMEASEVIDKTI